MTNIEQLITLNVELEGLLRVLGERDSVSARSAIADKFRIYSGLLQQLLDNTAEIDGEEKKEEDNNAAVEAPEEATEETPIQTEEIRREPNTKLIKAFTLNDRFRFRRELFNGNDADFTDTLTLLADMDSYDEAADYLVNDMMWEKDKPTVRDFMDILAQYMPR